MIWELFMFIGFTVKLKLLVSQIMLLNHVQINNITSNVDR